MIIISYRSGQLTGYICSKCLVSCLKKSETKRPSIQLRIWSVANRPNNKSTTTTIRITIVVIIVLLLILYDLFQHVMMTMHKCLLTVADGVFPLVLCLYYICITLTFSISVFNCGLSILNKRILLLLLLLQCTPWMLTSDPTHISVATLLPAFIAVFQI